MNSTTGAEESKSNKKKTLHVSSASKQAITPTSVTRKRP